MHLRTCVSMSENTVRLLVRLLSTSLCVRILRSLCVCIYIYIICISIYIYIYIYIYYVYIYIYTCICIHIFMCTYDCCFVCQNVYVMIGIMRSRRIWTMSILPRQGSPIAIWLIWVQINFKTIVYWVPLASKQ